MAAEGLDFMGGEDLDPGLREAPSARWALSDAIVRRLRNRQGVLTDFPQYGCDLTSIVGTTVSDTLIRQRVISQCLAEEEVESATCTVERSGGSVTVSVEVEDGEGPFELTINVSDLGVDAVYPQG
jgi:hypothetical protein